MQRKIIVILLLAIAVFSLNACNNNGESGQTQETQNEQTQQQSSDAEESYSWPKDEMGKIPQPDSKITSVEKQKDNGEFIEEGDKTSEPAFLTVYMGEMTKEEAFSYYEVLKSSAEIEVIDESDVKIELSGKMNDSGERFSLVYDPPRIYLMRNFLDEKMLDGSDGN